MAEFHRTLEDHGRYLSSEVAELLQHQTATWYKLLGGALWILMRTQKNMNPFFSSNNFPGNWIHVDLGQQ